MDLVQFGHRFDLQNNFFLNQYIQPVATIEFDVFILDQRELL